ncbi:uncharacterized protein LOC141911949 [Tubulanus polymorphus]|uniref:uncharacterized protein LOC141911949 n=1 Tax=Tubulanus polymorphus TaxID=672921 RepID=UPI003DA69005
MMDGFTQQEQEGVITDSSWAATPVKQIIVEYISNSWTAIVTNTDNIWRMLFYFISTIFTLFIQFAESFVDNASRYFRRLEEEFNSTRPPQYSIIVVCIISLIVVAGLIYRKLNKSFVKRGATSDDKKMFGLNVFDLAKTAYEKGHAEAVIRLVNKLQYDVNYAIPTSGLTLFLCSCISGERKLVQFLINKGANINSRTSAGDSALYLATFGILNAKRNDNSNRFPLLHDLIEAGCSVNSQNKSGYTALHRAASKGNIPLIKFLLQKGASPYLCSTSKVYPIDSAINAGHLEAAELLTIRVKNPHVWDIIEPHTPPRIQLGLQTPQRKKLVDLDSKRLRKRDKKLATMSMAPPKCEQLNRVFTPKREMASAGNSPVMTFKGRGKCR